MTQVHDMDHFKCRSCGTWYFPDTSAACSDSIETETDGRPGGLGCPHCEDQQLDFGKLLGHRVCCCSNCRGYLIGSLALGHLVNTLRSAYEGPEDIPVAICPEELQLPARCPVCRLDMETHPYYGPGTLVIDSCCRCHVTWLNYGELIKIVRAPGRRECLGTAVDVASVLDRLFSERMAAD
jgi:Zn-finger nucleic acid-binding protein